MAERTPLLRAVGSLLKDARLLAVAQLPEEFL